MDGDETGNRNIEEGYCGISGGTSGLTWGTVSMGVRETSPPQEVLEV